MSERALHPSVAPRDPKGRREGFTTGACAAAAAKAATRVLVLRELLSQIVSTLPNGQDHTFTLERCERTQEGALCSVIKDAGDDPDCTHGAEIVAEVVLTQTDAIEVVGGEGVATVTKPGLGLTVGGPAINPVPRKNIIAMVRSELGSGPLGARVTISVPAGRHLAKHTISERLGLFGGISILGTTGIVKPYSTAAYKVSVVRAIDVASELGTALVVLTTGGKTERYAMRMFPQLPPEAFVRVGDFIGVGIKHCARRGLGAVLVVGMIGKLSKMADGKHMTHAAGSEVNLAILADLAHEVGADASLVQRLRTANTARHVLELTTAAAFHALPDALCVRVSERLREHASTIARLNVMTILLDFDGRVLGRCAQEANTLPLQPQERP